jgi:hypothetical protein
MGPFISGIIYHHKPAAAETGGSLIQHSEGKPGSNGGIDRVATLSKHLRSSLSRQWVVRNNDARAAALLGVARERRDKEKYENEDFRLELARAEHKEERFTLCLNLRPLFCNLKIFARSRRYVTFEQRVQ